MVASTPCGSAGRDSRRIRAGRGRFRKHPGSRTGSRNSSAPRAAEDHRLRERRSSTSPSGVPTRILPLFFGATIASAVLGVIGALEIGTWRGRLLLIGGVLYVAGMFGVTMVFNVPLNDALAAINAESRTSDAIWRDYV